MTNFTKTNLSDKKASYEVFLILAKNGKAFRDGDIVKCAIKMPLAFGDTKMAKYLKLYLFLTELSQGEYWH